jgi:uncharacterized membrane protein
MGGRARFFVAAGVVATALTWSVLLVATPAWRAADGVLQRVTASVVYAVAGRVCHQRPDRSFAVAGTPLPVCARCSGLYLSGALGSLLALLWALSTRGRSADDVGRWRLVFVASAVPTAVSLALEVSGLAQPSALVRAVCALPLGAVTGWVTVRAACGWLR